MKNRILQLSFLLVILFLTSCSDDGGSTGPVEPTERILNETITSHYKDGEEYLRVEALFLSGKEYLTYTYEGDILVAKVEYKYNTRGQVERLMYYYNDNLETQENFTYDAKNRFIEFYSENIKTPEMAYYREFEYPENGTIIEQQKDYLKEPLPGGMFVYSLNEMNLISKVESEDGKIFEAEFEGNQITSVSAPNDVNYVYFYDDVNLVQGDFYKKYFQSIYGMNVNNGALYLSALTDIPLVYSDKFLLSMQSNNESLRYDYSLDLEGYPIKRDYYDNDLLASKTIYVYQ
jgi:hypothetical protein